MSKEQNNSDSRSGEDRRKRDDPSKIPAGGCRRVARHNKTIFSDRRSASDRRKQDNPGKIPDGRCRRIASRRSGSREFSAMPWWLRTNYTGEESISPSSDNSRKSKSRKDRKW